MRTTAAAFMAPSKPSHGRNSRFQHSTRPLTHPRPIPLFLPHHRLLLPPYLLLLLLVLLTPSSPLLNGSQSLGVPLALAAPFRVTDAYKPVCGGLPANPPRNGWKRWSDPKTWGQQSLVPWKWRKKFKGLPFLFGVPGRGLLQWRDVTIPCGAAILLDMPEVRVGKLKIKGWLKVLDSPKLPHIRVKARFILVMGRLTAGSASRQLSSRLTVTLHPNTGYSGGRKPYMLRKVPPADRGNPRDLGHKAFAVVGGQVDLHGMPGGADTPSWVRLAATAAAGQRQLVVEGDVTAWQPGFTVAVAATSTDFNEAESREIESVTLVSPTTSRITLTSPLSHTHEGTSVPDGFGGTIDIRAEVAMLDRRIVIQGTDEPAPHQYDGGHFMVYMTPTPQTIEGVQFRGLGHQGTLGRYPLHFHVCGLPADASQPHVVRKNAIVHTKQRCMVIHATSNMSIEDNVTYETKGHCFLVEEGSETGNVFRRNLGMSVRQVERVIPPDTSDPYGFHTDKQPSVFWLATPFNSFFGNVAAGSDNSGFWLEANPTMRGLSRLLPAIGNKRPDRFNWGEYVGNVAHSSLFGFRTYPHGSQSRFPNYNGTITYLKDSLFYRNKAGILFVNTERIVVENGAFVENAYGMDISRNGGVTVKGCRFVGTLPSTCTAKARSALRSSSISSSRTSSARGSSIGSTSLASSSIANKSNQILATAAAAAASPLTPPPTPLLSPHQGPTTEWEPPGLADAIRPWAEFLYPLPSWGTGDSDYSDGTGGLGDYSEYGDYADGDGDGANGTGSSGSTSSGSSGSTGNSTGNSMGSSSGDSTGSRGGETELAYNITAGEVPPWAESYWLGYWREGEGGATAARAATASAGAGAGAGGVAAGGGEGVAGQRVSLMRSDDRVHEAEARPQKEIGDGSFDSPIGVTLSQSNPADILRPSSVEDSFFSGYGACTTGSFGIALVTNKPGGYWNTAFFVQNLSFALGSKRFWATPNPPATIPPRGGLIARFYALRDLDGSLLGTPGAFAVAPYSPILPPASVRASVCQYRGESAVYQCESVCYRAVGVFYHESGVRPNGMAGLPAKVLRPYSYINITREEDGETFTAYGTDNDNPDSPPADPKRNAYRYVTASLLAGYTYRFTIIPAPTNSLFYPTWAQVWSYDRGGCEGGLKIKIEGKDQSTQWFATDAPSLPCSGAFKYKTYKEYLCPSSSSTPLLQMTVGPTSYGALATMKLNVSSPSSCSPACS
ncbi:hypothetical protein CLOP_g11497 [Closterium sp. NIES-67]|nr:hypothetical protein CLOP_g11497 [Closterium sp. NIES-67]